MKLSYGDTFDGVAGKAQEVLIEQEATDRPDTSATLASYFLTCPGQSIAWDNYLLSIIHLRDIEGVKPAHKRFPEATHEVMLLALNPEKNPHPLDNETWDFLHPHNLMHQVKLPSDEDAKDLLRLAARAVVDGRLWAEPPLSGQREPWVTTLDQTAEHVTTGHHYPADGQHRHQGLSN